MTAPEELPATPDDEMTALEEAAVSAVAGQLAAQIGRVIAGALTAYEAVKRATQGAPPADGSSLRSVLLSGLAGVRPAGLSSKLRGYELKATALGARRATQSLPRSDRPDGSVELPEPVRVPLEALVRERLAEAAKLARSLPMTRKRDVLAVIGRAGSARALAEAKTRERIYSGASQGVMAVAVETGRNLLWVPERDACLHCLAHAGWVVEPGQEFPRVTFGDKPLAWAVEFPPLHPNCRCELHLTRLKAGPPSRNRSAPDPASRLAAEARRSVILGWTDNASQAATMRAMDRLLKQGAGLPASVEARARRALRTGTLPRRPK